MGYIVWTRKFVGFGDKTDDVRTKERKKMKNKFAAHLSYLPE